MRNEERRFNSRISRSKYTILKPGVENICAFCCIYQKKNHVCINIISNQWNYYQATTNGSLSPEKKEMMCIQISMSNINFTKILFFVAFHFAHSLFLFSWATFFFHIFSCFVCQLFKVIIYLLVYIISHMLFAKCAYFLIFPHASTWTKKTLYRLFSIIFCEFFFLCLVLHPSHL